MFSFLFKSFVKGELSFAFTMNLFGTAENSMEKVNYLIKTGVFFLLLVVICVPLENLDS